MAHRILFADDDEDDRFLMSEAFKQLGFMDEIYLAESGLKLLGYLDSIINNEQLPVVIVLDLNMPFLNGIETLARLKSNKRCRNIPVVIHSNSINELAKAKCLELGAADFLVKSKNFEQFLFTAKFLHEYVSALIKTQILTSR